MEPTQQFEDQVRFGPKPATRVPTAPRSSDQRFADLVRRIKTAGLMERRTGAYVLRCFFTAATFVGSWVAFAFVGNSWWQLAVAAFLAIAFTQVAFLAHDAGHRQAFRSRKANDALLLVTGNLSVGIASGWWFGNHNRHHAHPNNTELDPDVGLRFYAYSDGQMELKRGIDRFVSRYQDRLYFPLLSLLGFSLHLESVAVLFRNGVKRPWLEGSLLAVHFAAYGAAIALTLSPGKAIAFVLLHQMLFGLYLGSTFAPNHKGMEMYEGVEPSFLDRQVRSSRNVTGGWFIDYVLGGLNHQIEHHLFPSMPRPNLAKAKPIVKSFCKEVGLPYEEQNVFGSVNDVVRYLRSVSSR